MNVAQVLQRHHLQAPRISPISQPAHCGATVAGQYPKGAGYLADALEDNRSIRKINLNGNRIKDEGVMEIARALKVKDVLEAV